MSLPRSHAPSQVPVTVCVRVRPFSARELNEGWTSCITCTSRDQLQLNTDRVFRFDRVFPPTTNQVDIYTEYINPLVTSCLNGINCTVFAYGQTGSGKTYTLGSEGKSLYEGGASEGIIPRALHDLFRYVKEGVISSKDEGVASSERESCRLSVSYVEVYKEEIRDLLSDDDNEINIREDESGRTVLSGVVDEEVNSVEEALNLLETGNAMRVTMATEMNAHSSRSHVAFIVTIVQEKRISLPAYTDRDTDTCSPAVTDNSTSFHTKLISKFHFVDLAGSERVDRTHNTGERFKESVHINGGLLALGNVINALTDSRRKSSHIPYRDSKITRLLKDSLGGHAHTVMITCLSPCERDLPETINTLKYAKRARNIKNHPIVNQDSQTASVLAMKDEIENLRSRLQHVDSAVSVQSVDSDLRSALESVQSQYQSVCSVLVRISEMVKDSVSKDNTTVLMELQELLATNDKDLNEEGGGDEGVINEQFHDDSNCITEAMETIESLRKEIEKYKLDLLADEELLAVKERELSGMRNEHEAVIMKNNQLQVIIRETEEREEQLLSKIHLLEEQVKQFKSSNLVSNSSDSHDVRSHDIQSHDSKWIDTIYEAVHDKIDMSFLESDVSNESCDRILHQMMSLLMTHCNSNDVMRQSHDSHVEPKIQSDEMNDLHESIIVSQKRLQSMEKWFVQEQQNIRSLNLKIKLKEELIQELIRNNKSVQSLNEAYQRKINSLETEAKSLKTKLKKVTMPSAESFGKKLSSDEDLRQQLEAKLKHTETKLSTLQKRRQETLRLLQTGEKSEQRIAELEGELERLRNKQSQLRKKVKEEGERKRELEREMERCEKKVNKLTRLTERQGQVLRVKTEEVAIAQRKLREAKRPFNYGHETKDTCSHWLEEEVQKLSEKKRVLDKLQKELGEREAILKQHEAMLKEKTILQAKKRQTQRLSSSHNVLHLSQQLEALSEHIRKKQSLRDSLEECPLSEGSDLQNEIDSLNDKYRCIKEKKKAIEDGMSQDKILSQEEEMRLLELQEQIEVLETSLQLKMTSLHQQISPEHDDQQGLLYQARNDGLIELECKVKELSQSQAQCLLMESVLRISSLEETLRNKEKEHEKLSHSIDAEKDNVDKMRQSLVQLQLDKQRKLHKSQKEHAREISHLLSHVTESVQSAEPAEKDEITRLKQKIKSLERDLYFYRKTSRDLKKKLSHND